MRHDYGCIHIAYIFKQCHMKQHDAQSYIQRHVHIIVSCKIISKKLKLIFSTEVKIGQLVLTLNIALFALVV